MEGAAVAQEMQSRGSSGVQVVGVRRRLLFFVAVTAPAEDVELLFLFLCFFRRSCCGWAQYRAGVARRGRVLLLWLFYTVLP